MEYKNQPPVEIFNNNDKKDPSLSILIPTFKRINLLENAIISAIKQDTSLDYEIIVVDNDQSKDSLELIRKLSKNFPYANLTLYQHRQNIGLYGNWNACLSLGRAIWMTILSDDDLLKPNWLRVMWEAKDNLRDPILLGCELEFNNPNYHYYEFFKNCVNFIERKIYSQISLINLSILDYFIEMPHQGCLGIIFNRNAAINCGGFDPSYHPCADYKLLSNLAFLKKSYLIKKKLATYLIGVNVSKNPDIVYQGISINKKIQENLISYMSFKINFIYQWYVNLFLARSISGFRKHFRKNHKIQNFIKKK